MVRGLAFGVSVGGVRLCVRAQAKLPSYKLRMKQLLPNLKQLDANFL